ncbi:MAG: HAMP domain-containing histidine kinase [Bacteroidales bacterium]|nr:HAMP domain-containing histidine kinase [Bacteroidales bacterium]
MDSLSLNIIIFIASGISVIMGLYMLFLHNSAKSVKGPIYWAVGNLLIGVGLMLRLITPIDDFMSHTETTLFVTFGLYVYLAGIWSFKKKEIKRWVVIFFPLFDLVQTLVFFHFLPSRRIRIVLHILVLVIFSAISIYEMLQLDAERKYLRKIFRLNALSFIAFLTVLIAGMAFVAMYPQQNEIDYAWMIAYGLAGGLMTALTFGFLSAVNLQLYMELAEQLKTKSKFFSIITHDLRGPVGTLMGFVNLLNNQEDLDEQQRLKVMENLEILSQSSFHLLQNLLEWANTSVDISKFEEEVIDLNQLIDSNIKFFQSLTLLKSIRLEFQQDEDVYVKGNSKMIETVIRNLVSNAIKFTPRGGLVTITSEKDTSRVRLTVGDTGVGIEPKRLGKIFDMENTHTTNGTNGESGSGLGLALCKDFVTKNGGTIRVESQVNAGTRFIVDLPSGR